MSLTQSEIGSFREDGFLELQNAVPDEVVSVLFERCLRVAEEVYQVDLEAMTGDKIARLVERQGQFTIPRQAGPPFTSLNTSLVLDTMNDLCGSGCWVLGHFDSHGVASITMPGIVEGTWSAPYYSGRWHIDEGFDYNKYFLNNHQLAVLPIFLLTDHPQIRAPTCAVKNSHKLVVPILKAAGATNAEGALDREPIGTLCEAIASAQILETITLTGKAGTVYFVHPWIVHCSSANLDSAPRAIINTGVGLYEPRNLTGDQRLSVVDQTIWEEMQNEPQAPPQEIRKIITKIQHLIEERRGIIGYERLVDNIPDDAKDQLDNLQEKVEASLLRLIDLSGIELPERPTQSLGKAEI